MPIVSFTFFLELSRTFSPVLIQLVRVGTLDLFNILEKMCSIFSYCVVLGVGFV